MIYDTYYKDNKNAFGIKPEKILVSYKHLLNKELPILDIGAGEGRNTIYLAGLGYSVDAIEPSSVAVKVLEDIKIKDSLKFITYLTKYQNFESNYSYSGVLLFGILQILRREEIDQLKSKLTQWMKRGSLLFLTAFTTSDESYKTIKKNSKKIGKNSYLKSNGETRTFFEPNEIKYIFKDYKQLYYWEGLGPEHRHGESPIERHSMVEAVLQRIK